MFVILEDAFASSEGSVAPNIPPRIKPGKAKAPSLASPRTNNPITPPKALEGTPVNPKTDQRAAMCFSFALFSANSITFLFVN